MHASTSRSSGSVSMALGLSLFAAVFSSTPARALDIAGLITVNGFEAPDIVIAPYDCVTGVFLPEGFVKTVPTQVIDGVRYNFLLSVNSDDVRLELYYGDCRGFVPCGQIIPVDGAATVFTNIQCAISGPGTASIGFWSKHPDQWPVDSITIGGMTYTKSQVIQLLGVSDNKDKTRTLFRQLVAAKLNVLAGNFAACIATDIDAADAWIALHTVNSGVLASSPAWAEISAVSQTLDQYNSGLLCMPPRP